MGAIAFKGDIYPNGSTTAKDSVFDNTGTDLESTNAEDAIKEVNGKVGGITYSSDTETITIPVSIGSYDGETETIILK